MVVGELNEYYRGWLVEGRKEGRNFQLIVYSVHELVSDKNLSLPFFLFLFLFFFVIENEKFLGKHMKYPFVLISRRKNSFPTPTLQIHCMYNIPSFLPFLYFIHFLLTSFGARNFI